MADPDWDHPRESTPDRRRLSRPGGVTEWAGVCADLAGADGAAVVASSASHPDTRRVPYSTDAAAARVADLLYVLGVGPHAVSMVDGVVSTVAVGDAADRALWPVLVDELRALGVEWVQTYPIRVGDTVIGTVQLHCRAPLDSPMSDGIATLLRHLTDAIGVNLVAGLLNEPADRDRGGDLVNIAIGVLAARHAVTVETASAMLRAGTYLRGHSSQCEALRVVDSVGGPDRW